MSENKNQNVMKNRAKAFLESASEDKKQSISDRMFEEEYKGWQRIAEERTTRYKGLKPLSGEDM